MGAKPGKATETTPTTSAAAPPETPVTAPTASAAVVAAPTDPKVPLTKVPPTKVKRNDFKEENVFGEKQWINLNLFWENDSDAKNVCLLVALASARIFGDTPLRDILLIITRYATDFLVLHLARFRGFRGDQTRWVGQISSGFISQPYGNLKYCSSIEFDPEVAILPRDVSPTYGEDLSSLIRGSQWRINLANRHPYFNQLRSSMIGDAEDALAAFSENLEKIRTSNYHSGRFWFTYAHADFGIWGHAAHTIVAELSLINSYFSKILLK
jgi:hypothetical protein